MADINVLDSSVYNLISAGEVIERPSSVVKELIENAIDAAATKITLQIEEGGIRSITVSDNGSGMTAENLAKAFLPHATSKLKEASDLDSISTLGFRGEALASIAAVAQVTVKTKTENSELGNQLSVNAGKIGEISPCGCNDGTVIRVENLFYNTPVRARFLKKPKAEEGFITQIVSALILSNPDVSFRYIVDGKAVFNTVGGLEDAVFQIYSNDVANDLIYFDESFSGGYRIYGYTGKRSLSKHNKNYQTAIINGRIVQNQTVSIAASQAYGNAMMKRCFPVFVLNIIMPFDDVDVNVHPSKSEVRFRDPNKVFSCVYHAVSLALASEEGSVKLNNMQTDVHVLQTPEKISQTTEYEDSEKTVDSECENAIISESNTLSDQNKASSPQEKTVDKVKDISAVVIKPATDFRSDRLFNDEKSDSLKGLDKAILRQQQKVGESNAAVSELSKPSKPSVKVAAPKAHADVVQQSIYDDGEIFAEIDKNLSQGYEVVGQIFNTYLILQQDGVVYLVDQHAAHERFLYDELIEKINAREVLSQPMIVPYILDCDNAQHDFITGYMGNLRALGFDIEDFGGLSFKINAVPEVLGNINLGLFFADVFSDRGKINNMKSADLINGNLAQSACKAAIKAGDKLSEEQIRSLLAQMKNGVPVQCPHGRPAIVSVTRKDLDKLFKRIV